MDKTVQQPIRCHKISRVCKTQAGDDESSTYGGTLQVLYMHHVHQLGVYGENTKPSQLLSRESAGLHLCPHLSWKLTTTVTGDTWEKHQDGCWFKRSQSREDQNMQFKTLGYIGLLYFGPLLYNDGLLVEELGWLKL